MLKERLSKAEVQVSSSPDRAVTDSLRAQADSIKIAICENDERVRKLEKNEITEHEKQKMFAAKANEAIETLKERLSKAEAHADSSADRAEADGSQAEVDSLKSAICENDERIKKLEKSKIIKTQFQNIQKLKVSLTN